MTLSAQTPMRNYDREVTERRRREAVAAKLRKLAIDRHAHLCLGQAMPQIRMYVSPWVIDPADGCMVRFVRQFED